MDLTIKVGVSVGCCRCSGFLLWLLFFVSFVTDDIVVAIIIVGPGKQSLNVGQNRVSISLNIKFVFVVVLVSSISLNIKFVFVADAVVIVDDFVDIQKLAIKFGQY